MQTRQAIRALGVTLTMTTALSVSGCLSNPEPAPLVVATPALSPTQSPTPVIPPPTAASSPAASRPTKPARTKPRPSASPSPAARPVTAGEVATAVRSTGLPGLRVTTQPAPRTRVGIDTIFYTKPTAVSRTVTIRGTRVELSARAVSFTWSFGDGSSRTTSTPGAPYPHATVTHRYGTAATRYVTVTTHYAVSYRLAGRAWQRLSGSFSATGASTTLVVLPQS